jgi:two-component system, NtrC family, sensor kinase
MKDPDQLYRRYHELQSYVGWTDEDAARVHGISPLFEAHLPTLVEDFYAEIARHAEAHKVFTGGVAQIDRLKGALLVWLRDLLSGPYWLAKKVMQENRLNGSASSCGIALKKRSR